MHMFVIIDDISFNYPTYYYFSLYPNDITSLIIRKGREEEESIQFIITITNTHRLVR